MSETTTRLWAEVGERRTNGKGKKREEDRVRESEREPWAAQRREKKEEKGEIDKEIHRQTHKTPPVPSYQ